MANTTLTSNTFPAMNTLVRALEEEDFGPPSMPWMTIAYYTCEVILGVCAAVGNATIVALVAVTKKLHSVPNTYLVSLAVTDFCMGVIGIPSLLLALNGYPRNYGLCMTLLTIVLMLDLCSMYSLMAHTFNQYYSTCHPLRYPNISTTRRVIFHIFLAWAVPLTIALVMPIGWNNGDPTSGYCILIDIVSMDFLAFMFFVGMIPPFVAMCVMYRSIFKAISKQMQQAENYEKIRSRLHAPPTSTTTVSNKSTGNGNGMTENKRSPTEVLASDKGISRPPSDKDSDKLNKRPSEANLNPDNAKMTSDANEKGNINNAVPYSFKRVEAERKKALFFCFLMFFLFFTWCPIFTLDSILAFKIVPVINQHALNLAVLLSHFNSAFNPVIYARKSEFRLVLRKWWARLMCKNRRIHPVSSNINSVSNLSGTNQYQNN